MIGKSLTVCTYGYETILVQVEADILPGTIGMQIVGLGDNAGKTQEFHHGRRPRTIHIRYLPTIPTHSAGAAERRKQSR